MLYAPFQLDFLIFISPKLNSAPCSPYKTAPFTSLLLPTSVSSLNVAVAPLLDVTFLIYPLGAKFSPETLAISEASQPTANVTTLIIESADIIIFFIKVY